MVIKKFKEFFNTIDPPIRKYFLFSCLDTAVGAVGMIVYGALTATYGPVWTLEKKAYYYIDLVYFIVSSILPFLLIIFYGMSIRIDGIIWMIYLFAVNLTNIFILFLKRKHLQKKEAINNVNDDENNNDEKNDNNDKNDNEISKDDTSSKDNNQETLPKRPKWKTILIKVFQVLNAIFRVFFIIVFCLLLNGAIIEGVGRARYPARGKIIEVKISNNTDEKIKFHYLCDGAKNDKPVFLFEGSASHGLADYLALQTLLKQSGRRSCIWDKPGLGYSDYLYTKMKDYYSIYDNLITSLGEIGPFEFVGWGAGGSLFYEYALQNPKIFKSLTFLDVSPNNIEFTIPYVLKNWTQQQLNDYKNKEIASRKSLFGIINGIGVPFGLMNLVIPGYKSFLSYLENEINWYFYTEKTWITQEYYLPIALNDDRNMSKKIDQNITLNILMTVKSDDQIKNLVCKKRGFAFDSADCKYEIDSNKLSIYYRANLISLSANANSKTINCTLDDCDLGYFVGIGANYTVDKLLQI